LPADPKDVPDYLTRRLNRAYNLFLKTAPGNSFATVDEDGWHLSSDAPEKLDAEAQARLDGLKRWLAQRLRMTRLPDLLIEVDNDLLLRSLPASRSTRQA
jgi:hypothetical protein